MKKEELINRWLAKGKLLSPEVFKHGEPDFSKLSGELVLQPKPSPKILKKLRKKESRSVKQIQKFYRERFEKLKAILCKKLDQNQLLSINKLSKGVSGIIIGMVCKLDKASFLLEDLTGCVRIKNSRVIEDEVIAVRGEYDGKFFKPRELIRPDTEMKVRKAEIDAKILFLSGPLSRSIVKELASSYKALYVFILDCDDDFESKKYITLSTSDKFAFIKLAGLRIMLLSRKLFSLDESLYSWLLDGLRRRHLNPLADWKTNDALLLRSVPDIIHCSSKSARSGNYKGTSILLTSNKKGFLIDLQSRKIEKVSQLPLPNGRGLLREGQRKS